MSGAVGQDEYSGLAKAIHWFVALCVFALIPVGFVMARMDEGPTQDSLYTLHESFGFLVLVLCITRISMRLAGRMPEPSGILTPFEREASRIAHIALYILLILTPLAGWLGASASGEDISIFGLFRLPLLIAHSDDVSDEIFAVHLACALLILSVVFAHLLGALVHGLRRDGVNTRMRPF